MSRAKLTVVTNSELRLFIGATPPADPMDYGFAVLDTKTPYLQVFDGADAGHRAHWIGSWANERRTGPVERYSLCDGAGLGI